MIIAFVLARCEQCRAACVLNSYLKNAKATKKTQAKSIYLSHLPLGQITRHILEHITNTPTPPAKFAVVGLAAVQYWLISPLNCKQHENPAE
jgi:hypothetical protein